MMISLHKVLNDASQVSGYMVIGSFLFLRFFCPALVSPQKFGILKGSFIHIAFVCLIFFYVDTEVPPPKAQRSLILLAKLIQNVINSEIETNEMEVKESYFSVTQDFTKEFSSRIESFAEELLVNSLKFPLPRINQSCEFI